MPAPVKPSLAAADKVVRWRFDEVIRMFPKMPVEQAEQLAFGRDGLLLERTKELHDGGCPTELAFEILS